MLTQAEFQALVRPADDTEARTLASGLSPETLQYIHDHWDAGQAARMLAYRRAYQAGFITDSEPGS